ncbi:MAG: four helix bundle protein [Flavobacteriales bacterium]|nr:four helix bundle protein [Flavobacteriales bacterium]
MFDFEKLIVYQKSREFYVSTTQWVEKRPELSKTIRGQLERASLSIALNIAEGTARFTKADKRNFLVIARGSVFECYAIFDVLEAIDPERRNGLYDYRLSLEEISKMLFAMIKNLQ